MPLISREQLNKTATKICHLVISTSSDFGTVILPPLTEKEKTSTLNTHCLREQGLGRKGTLVRQSKVADKNHFDGKSYILDPPLSFPHLTSIETERENNYINPEKKEEYWMGRAGRQEEI